MNDCVRHALPTFLNFQHRNVKKKVIDRNLKKKTTTIFAIRQKLTGRSF